MPQPEGRRHTIRRRRQHLRRHPYPYRPHLLPHKLTEQLLEKRRRAVDDVDLWSDLDSGWLLLDTELLPSQPILAPERYAAMGVEGMADRSSRPHRTPTKTSQQRLRQVVALRWRQRLGPVAIGAQLGMPASTVHAVLTRCRINRLHHIDVRTGEVVRRYEHQQPGAMIHVDVKKLGNIPDGGGWRYVGRQQGQKNRTATPDKPRNVHHNPKIGTAFVHTVTDDHSRVAYAEIHDDETAATAIGVLRRAVSWFAARGVTVERGEALAIRGADVRLDRRRSRTHSGVGIMRSVSATRPSR